MVGGTLYATWGLGLDSTDWNVAAEKAAIRVHEANPNMLIIVGGIFTGGFIPAYIAPIRVPNQVKICCVLDSNDFEVLSVCFDS